jgi:hypothetical protein
MVCLGAAALYAVQNPDATFWEVGFMERYCLSLLRF